LLSLLIWTDAGNCNWAGALLNDRKGFHSAMRHSHSFDDPCFGSRHCLNVPRVEDRAGIAEYDHFGHLLLEWKNRTLRLFTQAA